jgi:hypothetical protein
MSSYNLPATLSAGSNGPLARAGAEAMYPLNTSYNPRPAPGIYGNAVQSQSQSHSHGLGQVQNQDPYKTMSPQPWEHQHQGRFSPTDSVDDIIASPSLSDYSLENGSGRTPPNNKNRMNGKPRSQRRPSNRDEFDGPHQFLQRPPPEYIAMQERELPHLPTNLLVQEQDSVLSQVNDRLSQCAYDFVAKYQFPIPLTQDMRPVERPQDREWYV